MRRTHRAIVPLRLAVVAINLLWILLGDWLSLALQLLIPVLSVVLWVISVHLRCIPLSREGKKRCIRDNLWLLFIYYLIHLAVILLFGGLFHVERGWGGTVNLDLFHTVRNYWKLYQRTGNFESVSNLLGNVIVLLPLGVLLPMMFRPCRKLWITLPILALVAVGVEVLQYFLQSGIADVDDSLFNFLGAWFGYIVTRTIQMITK